MRHQGRDAPAARAQDDRRHARQGEAYEAKQLQGLLPEPLHRGADARKQLHQGRWPGRVLDLAAPGHGRGHRLQQRPAFGGQTWSQAVQLGHPFAAEQLHQQSGASGIQAAQRVQVHGLVRRHRAAQAGDPATQLAVMDERPVPANAQGRRLILDGGRRAHGERPASPVSTVAPATADQQKICPSNTAPPP
ncbi:hypothetical protein FQZ97_874080 [compost metagenome]